MKVADLIGAQLDYWVGRAEGRSPDEIEINEHGQCCVEGPSGFVEMPFHPSDCWVQGGPIIDRTPFGIFERFEGCWAAGIYRPQPGMRDLCVSYHLGDTLLIAAMRAYVASKFGDEVPDGGC